MHLPNLPWLDQPADLLLQRGLRFATRLAVAFGLATIAALLLGAAVTDNGFVQIVVTLFVALALWIPFTVGIFAVERLFKRGSSPGGGRKAGGAVGGGRGDEEIWRRWANAAPAEAQRIAALRSSLGKSRLQLGDAPLDADARDLCVLIDKRLPELIDRSLDDLAPDDRNRARELGELVDLVEQFARHCSRRGVDAPGTTEFEAAVLRRRFEARLSEF